MPLTTQRTSFTLDVLGRYTANTWQEAMDSADSTLRSDTRPFDIVVIGGGTFGATFAAHLFNADTRHRHRILVLEGGPLVLPEHQQNMPMLETSEVWGVPWTPGSPFAPDNKFPGLAFCVGGRSLFWGGWSPRFIPSELPSPPWPQSVIHDLTQPVLPAGNPKESYLDEADRQLGTDISNDFVHGPLHNALRKRLYQALQSRATGPVQLTGNRGALTGKEDLEAPLAVQSASSRSGFFPLNKFSSVPLMIRAARVAQEQSHGDDVKKRLMLVDNVHVIRLEQSDNRISRIVTNQGSYDLPAGAQVFLGLGTIENTRLAMHTFPENRLMGRNLMGHLRSNLTIRVPRASFGAELNPSKHPELQISAMFVKGIDSQTGGHFHVQITASGVGNMGHNSEAEMWKKIPDVEFLDSLQQMTDDYIVVTLRGIGEMFPNTTDAPPPSRIELDRDGPQGPYDYGTPRAKVRFECTQRELDLWEAMDIACDEIAQMLGQGTAEYLVNGVWQSTPGPHDSRHDALSSTHHEGGTLWMGDDPATSVTDPLGRVHESENLYVLGPALLPTLGSPNPMLSGVALTRRTADTILRRPPATPTPEAGFRSLFDGTEQSFKHWAFVGQGPGQGAFTLVDEALEAQPGEDLGLLYYATGQFANFVLRMQFRPHHAEDNSGVFVRFRDPRHPAPTPESPTAPLPYGNKAWVAVHTGFEIQIDDLARPNGEDRSRTGAIYDIPTTDSGPGTQRYQNPGALRLNDWNDLEIRVQGQTYQVHVNGVVTASFDRGNDPALAWRGKSPAEDPLSGYIGLQCYNRGLANTGRVAFRNIRIKTL